ncbi:hypothetical protein PSPO01_06611 [Paraphaeosphaeria sporulosa]
MIKERNRAVCDKVVGSMPTQRRTCATAKPRRALERPSRAAVLSGEPAPRRQRRRQQSRASRPPSRAARNSMQQTRRLVKGLPASTHAMAPGQPLLALAHSTLRRIRWTASRSALQPHGMARWDAVNARLATSPSRTEGPLHPVICRSRDHRTPTTTNGESVTLTRARPRSPRFFGTSHGTELHVSGGDCGELHSERSERPR